MVEKPVKMCGRCEHPDDDHALVATNAGPTPTGGVILCPDLGCQCYATWSVPQLGATRKDVREPGEQELEEMRWMVQTGGKVPPLTADERASLAGLAPADALRALFLARRPES